MSASFLGAATGSAPAPQESRLGMTALCSLLGAAPLFTAQFPPMVDLPQHAAQVATLLEILGGDADLAQLYRLNWFTPYLLGYLLVAALAPVLGIVLACKVIVAAALAAIPWAVRSMAGPRLDARWLWLLLPTLYGFAFHWGFLNFLVAVPVGLVVFGAALRHNEQPTLGSAIRLALAMLALFFCHALTCLFVGGLAGLDALLRRQRLSGFLLRVLPLCSVLPLMLLWGLLTRSTEAQVHAPIQWHHGWHRVTGLPDLVFGAQLGLVNHFGLLLVALPFALGLLRPARELRRWLPFLVTTAWLLFGPNVIFGNYFTYQRFGVFLVPFLFLATDPGPAAAVRQRWSQVFIGLAALLWLGLVTLFMRGFDGEARGFERVLAAMEPQRKVLQLMPGRDSRYAPAPAFLHFGSWYQALRHGPVDFSFAHFPVALVRYRAETAPPAAQGFEWSPSSFHWQRHAGDHYDYFLVRSPVDLSAHLFRTAPVAPVLLLQENGWWLYGRPPAPASAGAPAN